MAKVIILHFMNTTNPKVQKWDGLNGVWDDFNKKFVAPRTLDWSWTEKLLKEGK